MTRQKRPLKGDLRHQLFGSLNYFVNGVHVERIIFPINVIIIRNGIEDVFFPDELIVCAERCLYVEVCWDAQPKSIRYYHDLLL